MFYYVQEKSQTLSKKLWIYADNNLESMKMCVLKCKKYFKFSAVDMKFIWINDMSQMFLPLFNIKLDTMKYFQCSVLLVYIIFKLKIHWTLK